MHSYIKKSSIYSLLVSYLFIVIFGVLFTIPAPVQALGPEALCVPPLNELNEDGSSEVDNGQSGDNEAERFSPKGGWLQVEIINRATFSVSMVKSSGNCADPSDLKLSYISANEPDGSFASLIESIMIDNNLDDDFDYRRSQENNKDDHRIDQVFYPESAKIDGKRIVALTPQQLTSTLEKAEILLGIEEDSIPSVECPTTNGNFYLRVTSKKAEWSCNSELLSSWRGINIGAATGFSFKADSIQNFNIIYNVSEDGKKLEHVAEKNRGNDSFLWCESLTPQVFRNNCVDGNLEIRGVTPEQLISQADQSKIQLTITNIDNNETAQTLAAGSNTISANTVFDDGQIAGESAPTCESEGGVFGWILCPILSWSSQALEVVEGWITNRLELGPEYYEDEGVKGAWARIRNVAYIVLIPILLVMVISTALGFNFVDAYTVKRALPRLFIAIIFMALSYSVMVLMIQIVNDFGRGIGGLIQAPFIGGEGQPDELTLQAIFNPTGGDSAAIVLGGGVVLAGLAFGAISVVSVGVLASYMFVAALALLSIFFTLVMRQMLLLGMIIIAPLAILSWIFPGNDKLWKIFWGGFTKLLLLYPIIVAALITGRAFASIMPSGQGAIDSILVILLKLTAYIAPFFLIPAVFRYAGGAFANIAGIVNNRSKGVFDRQRKYRDGKKAETKQKSKNFSRFSDNNRFGKAANTFLGTGNNVRSLRRGRAGITAARQTGYANAGAEALKNDPHHQAHQNDDNYLAALASEDFALQKIAEDKRDMEAALAIGDTDTALKKQRSLDARQKGLNAARQVKGRNTSAVRQAALVGLAKTGYQFDTGEAGYKQLDTIARSIAGGDEGAHSAIMDESQYHLKNAGRYDLGGINHGAGYSVETGIGKAGLYQLANGKTDSIKAWGESLGVDGNGPLTKDNVTHYKELEAMKGNATGANKNEIVRQMKVLEDRGIKAAGAFSSGRIDPATGTQAMKYERLDATRASIDAEYQNRHGITPAEIAAALAPGGGGVITRMTEETVDDVASRESRKYEAHDPNRDT